MNRFTLYLWHEHRLLTVTKIQRQALYYTRKQSATVSSASHPSLDNSQYADRIPSIVAPVLDLPL